MYNSVHLCVCIGSECVCVCLCVCVCVCVSARAVLIVKSDGCRMDMSTHLRGFFPPTVPLLKLKAHFSHSSER